MLAGFPVRNFSFPNVHRIFRVERLSSHLTHADNTSHSHSWSFACSGSPLSSSQCIAAISPPCFPASSQVAFDFERDVGMLFLSMDCQDYRHYTQCIHDPPLPASILDIDSSLDTGTIRDDTFCQSWLYKPFEHLIGTLYTQ